jgi:hypothetical protein
MTIKLAPGIDLPLDVVTQAIAILAKRRMGKSYLARRLVEQLFGAGQQVLIIDPKGDWWGVRSAADGKSEGLPIFIFGGERGDVPLEAGSGALVAKTIVESGISALLDLSGLRKHEVATFMAVFLEDLYRLKAREQYRTPLALVIDEADAIAPQKPQPNQARMLGAVEDAVRRGGQRGIGVTLVTQRSAVLSKDVLTQAQILVTLRTIAPQDLAAIKAWIDVHGTLEQQKVLMASLPSLPVGDAWYWSPGWPTDAGIFHRGHTLPITTYDSGASPKPGQKRQEPKSLATVNLERIREQMAETLERAKADDPAELRKRIAELERQLKAGKLEPERVEVAVFDERRAAQLHADVFERLGDVEAALAKAKGEIGRLHVDYRKEQAAASEPRSSSQISPEPRVARQFPRENSSGRRSHSSQSGPGAALPKIERLVLTALAQCHDRIPMTRERLALMVGYHQNSKGLANALGALRSRGAVEGLAIKEQGFQELGDYEELPTGDALVEWWCTNKLTPAEARLLRAIKAGRGRLSRDELAEKLEYHPNTKAFANGLGRLRGLGIVEGLALNAEVFG